MAFLFGLLHFEYAENPGAFLSLGAKIEPQLRTNFFIIFSSILLACLLIYILYDIAKKPSLVTLAFTLYFAGGLGNLIDRFMHDGHVIDFMIMRVGGLHTGIFNVADMLLILGVGVLFLSLFKNETAVDETA